MPILWTLLGVAVLVSIVHYADNYLAYDRYPLSETLPNPSAEVVLGAWFPLRRLLDWSVK